MRYPRIKLSQVRGRRLIAEYPADPEAGSFIDMDRTADTIRVRVDRFSTIPFYYTVHQGRLYGASKFDLLLEELPGDYPRRLDRVAAVQFLRTNSMIGERTLLEGVVRVPYGCELRWRDGRASVRRYWQLPPEADHALTERQAMDRLHDAFAVTMKAVRDGRERLGMHLSAGMDSRQLLGGLLDAGVRPVVFTYGLSHMPEYQLARKLAAQFGLKHEVDPWPAKTRFLENADKHFQLTDGMQALFHGHGVNIHARQAERVDTVFCGHFLDLFIQAHLYQPAFERGGNPAHLRGRLYEVFDGGPCSIMRGDSIEPRMIVDDLQGAFRASMEKEIDRLDGLEPEKAYDATYLLHHGIRRLLPQAQSAAHEVDFRLPGLHRDWFEAAWSIPGRLRRYRQLQLKLLRDCYPATVARVPLMKDNRYVIYGGRSRIRRNLDRARRLAQRVGWRRCDYDYYGPGLETIVRTALWPSMRKRILQPSVLEAGVIRPDYLFEMDRAIARGVEVPVGLIGALYSLSRFIETFVERTAGANPQRRAA